MPGFVKCICYLALTGLGAFFLGRVLPKNWFRYDRAPYKPFAFEKNGKFYEAFGIRKWKDHLPDMSRILPKLIPSKGLPKAVTPDQLERMLQETCVAEWIHTLLMVSGLGCLFLWKGVGGWILYILYVLGNLPFNMIQRYNRPKLARIYQKLKVR